MPPPQNYFHWTPTYSPSFKLAESMDSDESSMESVSSSSPSFLETLSSPSVISSEYISPLPASSDDNYNLSSTVSHLMSSLLSSTLPPTPSPSSPSSSSSISSVSSSDSSSASPFIATATSLPSSSSLPPTTATSTIFTSSTGYPSLIPTITTRDLDFGDRFLLEEQRCVRLVPETYDPIISSLCGLIALIGLIYILCGYRLFRSALFLTGFLVSSSLVYTIILTTETPIPLYGTLIITLSTGLLIGLVTFLVAWVGLFLLGFNLGTLLGILIILSIHFVSPHVDTLSPPQSIWITFSMIGGWGIIGAFSALYFQKGCTILATCMFGSTFVIAGLDYFVESFNLFLWFWENLKADGSGVWGIGAGGGVGASSPDGPGQFLCLISWILIMLWVILVALGLFCQWCATGRGYYHSGSSAHASSSRRNGTLDLVKIRAEESKTEQKQRKYRYLYQVRTAHGDVISQHYIQSFQKKLSPPMDHHHDSLRTYNSDLSHLTSYNQSESRTTTMSHLP